MIDKLTEEYYELIENKIELEEAIFKIKHQIENRKRYAEIDDKEIDSKWFAKANYALTMHKLDLKKLNVKVERHKNLIASEVKKDKFRQTVRFESAFVDACRQNLTKGEYLYLYDKANEILKAREKELENQN